MALRNIMNYQADDILRKKAKQVENAWDKALASILL